MNRPISSDDIEFYQRNGYIQFEGFLSDTETVALRRAIDDAVANNRERIVGAEKGGRQSDDYERVFNRSGFNSPKLASYLQF